MKTKALSTKVNEVAFLSNTFVRSPLALNNVEARIFALALGCLHQKAQSLTFRIEFSDISRNGSTGGKQYAELTAAQNRLTQPLINTSLRQGQRRRDAISLFTILSLDEGTKLITGEFNPRLKEHLLDLGGKFTTVELESLLTLKTAHSHRLFWILRSYQNQTWDEPIAFETLREWLFGENSDQYSDWSDFNRYVLKPAIAEFVEIGWDVSVSMQKRGRKADTLLFKMVSTKQPNEQPSISRTKKALTLAQINEFRGQLAAIYEKLPALYDRLRLDFELKEYQAREVVNNIKDLTTYGIVTKALLEVNVTLINPNNIKSVAAYTLSQIKAVLPVYTKLGEGGGEEKAPENDQRAKLQQQLAEAQERLQFVQDEAPTTLFPEDEKASRVAAIQAEIDQIKSQLG